MWNVEQITSTGATSQAERFEKPALDQTPPAAREQIAAGAPAVVALLMSLAQGVRQTPDRREDAAGLAEGLVERLQRQCRRFHDRLDLAGEPGDGDPFVLGRRAARFTSDARLRRGSD